MNNFFYQLKIAIRNLRRGGLYSAINIGGLAVSLAACILIFLWVRDELEYNRGFKNADQIYQLGNGTPISLAPLIAQKIPEALHVCRTCERLDLGVLTYGADKFTITDVCVADSSFFTVFNFGMVKGNPQKPFEDKHSLVLSESMARRIFKDEEPVGRLIRSDTYGMLHVTAVITDMPENSSIQYSAILPFQLYADIDADLYAREDWSNWYFNTYAMFAGGVDAKALGDKITRTAWAQAAPGEEFSTDGWFKITMQKLTEIHLYNADGSPTGMKNVRLFSIAALVLLLIASINYVNLVTARLTKRTKEVGIRKILGSGRMGLFAQLIQESSLMFLLAMAAATILIFLLLPFYTDLTGKFLQFDVFSPEIWLIYIILFVVITLLAGVYPALMLSSFKPTGLTGFHSPTSRKFILLKALVVVQFTFSAGLIATTVVLGAQLNYMRTKDPGYARENIFYTRMYHISDHYATVRGELMQQGAIPDVTATRLPISNAGWNISREWQCKDGSKQFGTSAFWGDYNLLDFFNVPLVSGRKFTSDDRQYGGYVINRDMAVKLGWDDMIGRTMPLFSSDEREIIGEIENFNFQSYHQAVGPMTIFYSLDDMNYLYVKASPGNTDQAIAAVESVWKRYNDGYPFEYHFLDDEFERMYKSDIRTGKLFNIFAIIAILISCLGLFGLVTYTAETKTKEIGIRKVLGASVAGIVELLSKEFLILVGVAMLIAFPLAYYWLDRMLQDYAYRIDISWWMFALAGIVTLVLTLLTVGWQAVKAASANPVKSIKE